MFKSGLKIKYSFLFFAVVFALITVFSCVFFSGGAKTAYSEEEISSDAGIFNIKDDFRFNGLGALKDKYGFFSCQNVCTGDFGSYIYGAVPAQSFGEEINAKSGFLVYEFILGGNGVFSLFEKLSLTLNYKCPSALYNPSFSVLYAFDGTESENFVTLTTFTAANYGVKEQKTVDFAEVLASADLISQKLYVKIALNHDAAEKISISDAGINLYSVEFYGMQNFVMKKGAAIREALDVLGDLRYRSFISVKAYQTLTEKFDPQNHVFVTGNLIMPEDYIETYGSTLERENVRFTPEGVYSGNYPSPVVGTRAYNFNGNSAGSYTIEVNGVNYYYFDGAISNIKTKNVARNFMSRAYIRILNKSGEEVFFQFAAYHNQNYHDNSRSAVYLAQKKIEKNALLAKRLNNMFLSRLTEEASASFYIVNKVYIDGDFNIVDVQSSKTEGVVNQALNLSEAEKASEKAGYNYIGDSGVIKDGEEVIYSNSFCSVVYPSAQSVITLYYKSEN